MTLTDWLTALKARIAAAFDTTYNSTNWDQRSRAIGEFQVKAPGDLEKAVRVIELLHDALTSYASNVWEDSPQGRAHELGKTADKALAEAERIVGGKDGI